jgi:hypothetical protein
VIRKGTTRTVIVVGGFAVKLATDKRGRRCNRFEADLYERSDARRRAMLCPVLVCTPAGTALLMPAARPLTEEERNHRRRWSETDRSRCAWWKLTASPIGITCRRTMKTEPFEYKQTDWGWLNGRLVALDYSSPALF